MSDDKAPPFSDCSFAICDLPGQCRGEGKCHHPVSKDMQQLRTENDDLRAAVEKARQIIALKICENQELRAKIAELEARHNDDKQATVLLNEIVARAKEMLKCGMNYT